MGGCEVQFGGMGTRQAEFFCQPCYPSPPTPLIRQPDYGPPPVPPGQHELNLPIQAR